MIASVATKATTCTTELHETLHEESPEHGVGVTHQPRVGDVETDARQQIPQQPEPILHVTPFLYSDAFSDGGEEAGDDGADEGEEVDELDAVGVAKGEEEEEKRQGGGDFVLVDVELELALHGGLLVRAEQAYEAEQRVGGEGGHVGVEKDAEEEEESRQDDHDAAGAAVHEERNATWEQQPVRTS